MENHKQRIIYSEGDPSEEKTYYKNLIYRSNLAGCIQLEYIDTLTNQEINEYLRMVTQIPTLLATETRWRKVVKMRTSYFMRSHKNIIDPELKSILEHYFIWLKERKDYIETSEETMDRIQARAKIIHTELIETLYHPDRYDTMVATYGEVWADVHMPY